MRDLVLVMLVLGSVPPTLVRPQVGILMWFWLSLMNPHRLTWSYAQQFRVALVVGVATLIGWLVSTEAKRPPHSAVVYLLAAFTFWISLAALFAIHPEVAVPKWEEIIKILGMTFVTTCIVQSRDRIQQLVWVIAISLGFYGIKGGIFTIATGGNYRVYGPSDSFIGENNALALALIVTLPLMQYLRVTTENVWIKRGLLGGMGLTLVAVLGSYSRGALVGLAVMMGYFWLKSRYRLGLMIVTVTVLGLAMMWLPQQWFERMYSIESYEIDPSAQGRFDAWTFAFRLALDHPLVGGGQLAGTDDALFLHYVPTAPTARAAHSIYFEVLGESGFVGLGLFLGLLVAAFRSARSIIHSTHGNPDLAWARSLASMLQVSFLGYASTGAFLSLGFFDLYYALLAVLVSLEFVVRRELSKIMARQHSMTEVIPVPSHSHAMSLVGPPAAPIR